MDKQQSHCEWSAKLIFQSRELVQSGIYVFIVLQGEKKVNHTYTAFTQTNENRWQSHQQWAKAGAYNSKPRGPCPAGFRSHLGQHT